MYMKIVVNGDVYYIKNGCAQPGIQIPGTWEHFEQNGNYCEDCTYRHWRLAEERIRQRI